MNDKINKISEDLKQKGYFKLGNRGEVKRWSKIYNGFETMNSFQFKEDLKEFGISEKQAIEIKKNLPTFPNKQYQNYQDYLKCCKVPSFNKAVSNFENNIYDENSTKKNKEKIVLTVNSPISSMIQFLINNDIFTDGEKLYKYDVVEKSFILITENNISEFIGIENSLTCKKIYNIMMVNETYLTNIHNSIYEFKNSKFNDSRKKQYKEDYKYISDLIESIKKEYQQT